MREALGALFRAPRRARTILVLIAAAVTAAVLWITGADLAHTLTIALGAASAGLVWVALPEHDPGEWPDEAGSTKDGARREVVRLSWSLRPRRGRVQPPAVARVRDLARHRLALRGLDLDDPAQQGEIERLLGGSAHRVLQPSARRLPRRRALVECLDALDRLDPSRAGLVLASADARAAASALHLRDLFRRST
jgi:hypothetical protein